MPDWSTPDWNSGPTKGIVSDSVVVIVVPRATRNIKGWADLLKPGVKIITPNPASSGSARWNILAAYQQVIANGGTEADAKAYLTKFFQNVAALPGSGRDATDAFLEGSVDVLISYENEAILARQSAEDFEYIVPDATLRIENPAAVSKTRTPRPSSTWTSCSAPPARRSSSRRASVRWPRARPIGEVDGANNPAKPFPPRQVLHHR